MKKKNEKGQLKQVRQKILLIMKLTTVFLLLSFLSVSAITSAQQTTIKMADASLKSVFKEIKQKMGYTFIFNEQVVNKAGKVTVGTYVVGILYSEGCRGYIDSSRADYAGSGERSVPDNGESDGQEERGVAGGNGLDQGDEDRDSDGCQWRVRDGSSRDGQRGVGVLFCWDER